MNIIKLSFLAVLFTNLAACYGPDSYHAAANDPFVTTNYQAADALITSAIETSVIGKSNIQVNQPILVATIVNVDSLEESSRLGRIISEQLQARFTQKGLQIVELKLRGRLFVKKDQGELLLSREVNEISANQKAQAVVVGTYAVATNSVYVNLKMVGNDNIVLGAHDYTLPLNSNIKALLRKPCCGN